MLPAAPADLPLLHVDHSFLVLDKPPGLLAVPGRGDAGLDSLATRVQALFPDARIVHRLDMATSGLMLMARGADAQRALGRAFESRQVHKRYEAVVEGLLQADTGSIDSALAADWPQRPRQKVDAVAGKAALTHWQVLARDADAPPSTRLGLHPVTGRSHQLRVHLLSIGHPIRGDALYAAQPLRSLRLLLHATALGFPHPAHGQPVRFHCPAPF